MSSIPRLGGGWGVLAGLHPGSCHHLRSGRLGIEHCVSWLLPADSAVSKKSKRGFPPESTNVARTVRHHASIPNSRWSLWPPGGARTSSREPGWALGSEGTERSLGRSLHDLPGQAEPYTDTRHGVCKLQGGESAMGLCRILATHLTRCCQSNGSGRTIGETQPRFPAPQGANASDPDNKSSQSAALTARSGHLIMAEDRSSGGPNCVGALV